MGKRKSPSIRCNSRKRARQPSVALPSLEAVTHHSACAEDDVYCTVCQKKDGDDFLLCDACDGGMHRQCAKLDHIPASFWACTSCERRPTVESAIRQVLHEHSSSGLSEKDLLLKARNRVPLGISGRAELSKGLEQALTNTDPTHFDREYRVVRLKDRYYLVTTAAAAASSNQHLLPDSEDEQSSIRSSHTLGSADDSPPIRRQHIRHRISHSSGSSRQHSCPAGPPGFKGHQQEGTGSGGGGHPSAHDSATAKSSFKQQHCHSSQQSGHAADHIGANISHQGALNLVAAESVIPGQTQGGSVEKRGAAETRGDNRRQAASKLCFASSACHAPATLVQMDLNQQQWSNISEPQSCGIQACKGSTGLQQQQDSSLDVSNSISPAHLCTCLALAGVARFHAHTAATAVGFMAAYIQYVQMRRQHDDPCPDVRSGVGTSASKGASPELLGCKSVDLRIDSNSADEQLDAQTVEAPPANAVQELCLHLATTSEEQSLDVPVQLPSAEDIAQGAARFLSTVNQGDVMTMPAQLQRSRLFKAASQLVGVARYTKRFERHLDTLSSSHAARVVHTVCARIMVTSKVYTPEMAGIFIQQYWQSMAAC